MKEEEETDVGHNLSLLSCQFYVAAIKIFLRRPTWQLLNNAAFSFLEPWSSLHLFLFYDIFRVPRNPPKAAWEFYRRFLAAVTLYFLFLLFQRLETHGGDNLKTLVSDWHFILYLYFLCRKPVITGSSVRNNYFLSLFSFLFSHWRAFWSRHLMTLPLRLSY